MCGRFAMTIDPARLALELDAIDETGASGAPNSGVPNSAAPNYNVAPSTPIAVVVDRAEHRRIRLMRWGLLPPWVKAGPDGRPPVRGPQLINARAETVTTSPAFRSAAAHKRCLIPMDGYYEWQPAPEGAVNSKRGRKTPFYFFRPDGKPLLVAGLWSVWRPSSAAEPLLTCSVITTDAVGEFARIHDRMPLILPESDWRRWLDPEAPAPQQLLTASPDIGPMAMRQVTTLVNAVANNGPELIEPVGPGNQPVGLF